MNTEKQTYKPIFENEKVSKKSEKHDVNLKENSSIYFQIGLIMCLLVTYSLLEMKFVKQADTQPYGVKEDHLDDDIIYVEETPLLLSKTPVIIEPVQQELTKKKSNDFIEVPDNTVIEKVIDKKDDNLPKVNSKNVTTKTISPDKIHVAEKPSESTFLLSQVESVPIYPGCEKKVGNWEKRKCMAEKIAKLIKKKFNTDISDDENVKGEQVIDTEFTINKKGQVSNIKTMSPYMLLKQEANRVIDKIPVMVPGKHRGENVNVTYTIPIRVRIIQKSSK